MYTAPEYRGQGIAIHTLDLLVKDAKEQDVLQIALEATDMGLSLIHIWIWSILPGLNCLTR